MSTTGLKKSLNLFDSTTLVIGSMIGSGIFIVSADIARSLGSPGWLMISWLISGLLTVVAASSYGELACMMPNAGGKYVYLREAYNPLVGFLYGWTLFTVIETGSIAAVAMAFAKYSGVFIPWISEANILVTAGPFKFHTAHIIAILSILFLTWINTRGINTGKLIQNIFTSTKTIVLFGFIIIGLFFARNLNAIDVNSSIFWDAVNTDETGNLIPLTGIALIGALGASMVGSLFTYDAWYNVTFTSTEIINPKRNLPLSLFLGTFITTIIYLLVNSVYLLSLPLRGTETGTTIFEKGMQFAEFDRIGTASIIGVFGESAAIFMAILIIISTFGCNNGLILSGARVYYAMALDKLFFKKAGTLNNRSVPGNALILQAVWASLLCLSGNYSQLLDYVVTAVLIFFILTVLAIFILRIKKPDEERQYKAFGFPFIQIIYLIITFSIIVILLIVKPDYTWPGFLIVLIGIPVYYCWQAVVRRKSDTTKP